MEVKHRRKNHPVKLAVNMAKKAAANDVTLKFDHHQQLISEGIQRFFDSKCLLDVDVDCGGEVVAAHKLILGIFCPVLLQSLQQHPQDHVKQRISVDSRLQHIEYLIEFLYRGQVTLPKPHLKELNKVAEKLGVQELVDAIRNLKGKCRLDETVREEVRQEEEEEETNSNQVKGRKRRKTKMKLSQSEIEESDSESDEKSDTIDAKKSQLGLRNRTVTRSKESTSGVTYKKEKRQTQRSVMKCSFCDYETKDKYTFKSHLAEHDPPDTGFVCKVCSKRYRTKQGFRCHLRGHEEPAEPFNCTLCSFSTPKKWTWHQHLAVVHKVDPEGNPLAESVRCTECDFVCVAIHQLKAHIIRRHTAGKPFKCNECSYASVIRARLDKHISIVHRRERPFMCDECGFRSQTQSGFKRHKRSHSGVKPFKCDICGQEYADNRKLKIHLLRHVNDEKPFVCHLCGLSCRRRDNFKVHLKNVHKTTMDGNAELHASATAPNSTSSAASPPMVTPSPETGLVISNPVGNFQMVNFEDGFTKTPPSSPKRIHHL